MRSRTRSSVHRFATRPLCWRSSGIVRATGTTEHRSASPRHRNGPGTQRCQTKRIVDRTGKGDDLHEGRSSGDPRGETSPCRRATPLRRCGRTELHPASAGLHAHDLDQAPHVRLDMLVAGMDFLQAVGERRLTGLEARRSQASFDACRREIYPIRFTSCATTPKPLPASPARAASIVALRACFENRVCGVPLRGLL